MIPLRPVISEKSFSQADTANTYTFEVPRNAAKPHIAAGVAEQFKVGVTSVRTCTTKGKPKRMAVKRGSRIIPGRRSDRKKAYVTIKQGESIGLFEGAE